MLVVCQTSYVTNSYVGHLDVTVMMGPRPIICDGIFVSVVICDDLKGVNSNLNVLVNLVLI